MNNLYCYKMTWAAEFAPNPYHGILTLATCKPVIRRCAKIGDWISGWTSITVHDKNGKSHSFREGQRLIYLAKISDIIPIAEYWNRYPEKRPHEIATGIETSSATSDSENHPLINPKYDTGDNIYKPLVPNASLPDDFELMPNRDHGTDCKVHDISGKNVLICPEFYYFGIKAALDVDKDVFPYAVPRCKKVPLNEMEAFIEYVASKAHNKNGII